MLVRHGWLEPTASYEEARDLLVDRSAFHEDVAENEGSILLARLAHGMERLGRRYCRAAAPDCDECPLKELLPEGGPRGAED